MNQQTIDTSASAVGGQYNLQQTSPGSSNSGVAQANNSAETPSGSKQPIDDFASNNPDLRNLSANAVDSVAAYLRTELEGTLDDYALLENMNRVATNKYAAMKDVARNVEASFRVLNEREQQLAVHFLELQRIEHTLQSIEDVAYRLDAYSKRLETKFKQLLVEKD